jgi:hypothetical protein
MGNHFASQIAALGSPTRAARVVVPVICVVAGKKSSAIVQNVDTDTVDSRYRHVAIPASSTFFRINRVIIQGD